MLCTSLLATRTTQLNDVKFSFILNKLRKGGGFDSAESIGSQLPQTADGGPDRGGGGGGVSPGTSGDLDAAVLGAAVPDADGVTLHAVLSAEGAGVLCVLGDFHLLDGFSEGGTIASTILADNTELLSALGHVCSFKNRPDGTQNCVMERIRAE